MSPGEFPRPSDDRWQSEYSELATLAGSLVHEIRNPLSTMRLNLELLDEDLAEEASSTTRRMRQKLQVVLRECGQLERILNDFLQFSRASHMHLQVSDLNEQLRAFLDFYSRTAAEHGVELSPMLAAQLPPVQLDEALFRQALQNLVQNAQQAMPHGGRIELLTYPQQGRVVLELIDQGVGMDAATQLHLFDPFFSTKPGGSGLGLPTVRKILTAHHATIDCESAPGKGTRFRLSFPIDEPSENAAGDSRATAKPNAAATLTAVEAEPATAAETATAAGSAMHERRSAAANTVLDGSAGPEVLLEGRSTDRQPHVSFSGDAVERLRTVGNSLPSASVTSTSTAPVGAAGPSSQR
jgi:two-component system, NtrC family, sensor histidine kinase HydH